MSAPRSGAMAADGVCFRGWAIERKNPDGVPLFYTGVQHWTRDGWKAACWADKEHVEAMAKQLEGFGYEGLEVNEHQFDDKYPR